MTSDTTSVQQESQQEPQSTGLSGLIREAAIRFRQTVSTHPVRIICHDGPDGLTAAAIIAVALTRQGIPNVLRSLSYIDSAALRELEREEYLTTFLLDIGAGQYADVGPILQGSHVFLLDSCAQLPESSQELFTIDTRGTPTAAAAYLFALQLDQKNVDLIDLAVLGIIGEGGSSDEIASTIIEEALDTGALSVQTGIPLLGAQQRDIHRVLQHSIELFIPGVSGSERGSLEFLAEIGINHREENTRWRKYSDLQGEELQRIAKGINKKRGKEASLIGRVYTLKKQRITRDARDNLAAINACARTGKTSTALAALLGDQSLKEEAQITLNEYRGQLFKAIEWFEERGKAILESRGKFLIFNAGERFPAPILQDVLAIMRNLGSLSLDAPILTFSTGELKQVDVILHSPVKDPTPILKEITNSLEAFVSTGEESAHCTISAEEVEELLGNARVVFDKLSREEQVA